MAIIESLDADTETRRLSPVAILGKANKSSFKNLPVSSDKKVQFLSVRHI